MDGTEEFLNGQNLRGTARPKRLSPIMRMGDLPLEPVRVTQGWVCWYLLRMHLLDVHAGKLWDTSLRSEGRRGHEW